MPAFEYADFVPGANSSGPPTARSSAARSGGLASQYTALPSPMLGMPAVWVTS